MQRPSVSVACLALFAASSCTEGGSGAIDAGVTNGDARDVRDASTPADGTASDLDASMVCHADAGDLGLPPVAWAEPLAVDASERWTWAPPSPYGIQTPPVLGPDGTIYFWYGGGPFSNWLAALSPDGDLLWETEIQSLGRACLAVGTDGNVYGLGCGHILVVEPTGDATEYIFRPETYGNFKCPLSISCPSVGPDNTVYFTVNEAPHVFAYQHSDGMMAWTQTLPAEASSDMPIVTADGATVYVQEHGAVVALNATSGSIQWRTELDVSPGLFFLVGSAIYVGGGYPLVDGVSTPPAEPHFRGLRAEDGCVLWDIPIFMGGLVGPVGEMYDSEGSMVQRLSRFGEVEWSTPCSGDCTIGFVAFALGADGTLYATEYPGGLLYALTAESGEERWTFDLGFQPEGSSALTPDGTIYLSTSNSLHAIQTDSPGQADLP